MYIASPLCICTYAENAGLGQQYRTVYYKVEQNSIVFCGLTIDIKVLVMRTSLTSGSAAFQSHYIKYSVNLWQNMAWILQMAFSNVFP